MKYRVGKAVIGHIACGIAAARSLWCCLLALGVKKPLDNVGSNSGEAFWLVTSLEHVAISPQTAQKVIWLLDMAWPVVHSHRTGRHHLLEVREWDLNSGFPWLQTTWMVTSGGGAFVVPLIRDGKRILLPVRYCVALMKKSS